MTVVIKDFTPFESSVINSADDMFNELKAGYEHEIQEPVHYRTVISPGEYEGLPLWIAVIWEEYAMHGFEDFTVYDDDENGVSDVPISVFELKQGEFSDIIPTDKRNSDGKCYLLLWKDDQGFLNYTIRKNNPEEEVKV